MENLIEIRRRLHSMAELSGNETNTAREIKRLLGLTGPDQIISGLGGHGVAALYNSKGKGPIVMLRADMDALPIAEENDFDYISSTPNVSHKCGHDGHMTIMLSVASQLNDILRGSELRVVTLFQPAEETADGAYAVIEDSQFEAIKPDMIFGLHNLPGFPLGSVIYRPGVFASASKGFIARLKGRTSHAGHPENGNSPVLAMIQIIQGLMAIPSLHTNLSRAANITIIHARLGEVAFGTSPGQAEVMATFRSHHNEDMETMSKKATELAEGAASIFGLQSKLSWVEVFPATVSNDKCAKIVHKAAIATGAEIVSPQSPFPWSEDFGWYTTRYPGAFFGVGSGESSPQLHNPDYDFPDEIIPGASSMFLEIVRQLTDAAQ